MQKEPEKTNEIILARSGCQLQLITRIFYLRLYPKLYAAPSIAAFSQTEKLPPKSVPITPIIVAEKRLQFRLCGPTLLKSTIRCVLRIKAAVCPLEVVTTVSTTVTPPRLTTVDSAISGPTGSLLNKFTLI